MSEKEATAPAEGAGRACERCGKPLPVDAGPCVWVCPLGYGCTLECRELVEGLRSHADWLHVAGMIADSATLALLRGAADVLERLQREVTT